MSVRSTLILFLWFRRAVSHGGGWVVLSLLLAVGAVAASATQGLSFSTVSIWDNPIFSTLRLPRVLAGFGVGGLLALAGLLMQALLRNPLAEPYMLGAASGASFALLLGTVAGLSWWWLQGAAFVGALWVLVLMLILLRRYARLEGDMALILLLGVLLSALLNAAVNGILLLLPDRVLRGALFWMLGDLSGAGGHFVAWWGVWLCVALALPLARSMDALLRGAAMAHASGIMVTRLRWQLLLLAGLATALAVAEAGAVGFVGLVVPHAVKLFGAKQRGVGPRAQMLLCVLWGGMLLVVADGLARTVIAPMQLPVGILTTLLGAPFLAWQLLGRLQQRERRSA